MKHLPYVFLLSLFLIVYLFLPPISFSQDETPEFDFSRAYQDYLYTYSTYREAHDNYIVAREQYLNYKTLTAKTIAMEQTLDMLQKRDETIRTYLTALRMKMAETTGIADYKQNTIYLKLDSEVGWYIEHRDKLSSAATLEDLLVNSEEAEDRFGKSQLLAYQALGVILEGKENDLINQMDEQIEALKEKTSEIREKGDKDTTTAERWLLEAENKLTRGQEKIDQAINLLDEMKPQDRNKAKIYTRSQELFQESHLYLKESNSFLKELIREIKTSD